MRHIAALVATAGVILMSGPARAVAADAQASAPPPAPERPAHFALADAAPSIEVLLDRLLAAIAKKDAAGLHRLRVTESEYRTFVLPGSGERGEPGRVYDDVTSEFAWQKMNTNSLYAADGIIRGYGGHTYKLKDVQYAKGRKEYAWYTAYKSADLKLEDEQGKEHELALGSIAEIDGQFKFLSLLGNH